MDQLREDVRADDTSMKLKEKEAGPKASYGYGGQFGVEKDRMDKVKHRGILICWSWSWNNEKTRLSARFPCFLRLVAAWSAAEQANNSH